MKPTRRAFAATLAALPWRGFAAEAAPLRFAVPPYLSPVALLNAFRSLREHFERRVGTPVEMVTARDFTTLAASARRGEYDIAMLPAHLARVAVVDWSWQPLARPLMNTDVQIVSREAGPVATPADLRGRRVGMLDPQSLSAMVGLQWLRSRGLEGAVEIVPMPSANSALHDLTADGGIAALVITSSQLAELPLSTPQAIRVLDRVANLPVPWHLARPGVPAATVARWREALLAFEPNDAVPRSVSNVRLGPLTVADTEVAEPWAVFLRRQLAGTR